MMYIGIDPGVKGAIALIAFDGSLLKVANFPTITEKSNKGRNMSRPDLTGLIKIFSYIKENIVLGAPIRIMIEKPVLMPGQNVSSTFNNGKSHGIALTLLEVFFPGIEILTVSCKEWQDAIIKKRTPVISKLRRDKRKQLKLDSIATAQRLYPGIEFKKSKKSKVDSDGMTDAILIAYYCYESHEN